MKIRIILTALLILACFSLAQAEEVLSPEKILAKTYEYDNTQVVVEGEADNFTAIQIKRGGAPAIPFTLLDLKGSGDTVLKAAVLGAFKIKPGTKIIFSGSFYSRLHLGDKNYQNILVEGVQSCPYLKKMMVVEAPPPPPEAKEQPPLKPEQVLTSPAIYDRQNLRIIGEVQHLQLNTQVGNLMMNRFELIGPNRLPLAAISSSLSNLVDGQQVVASGVFYQSLKIDTETLTNVVEIMGIRDAESYLATANQSKPSGATAPAKPEASAPPPPPPPPPLPPPPPSLGPGLNDVMAYGRVEKVSEVKIANQTFPLLTVNLGDDSIQVIAMGRKSFSQSGYCKALGTYYPGYPLEGKTLPDVLSASLVEEIPPEKYKDVSLQGSFILVSGRLVDKSETKTGTFLILETLPGFCYAVFSRSKIDYPIGDNLKISGKLESFDQTVSNPPAIRQSHTYPQNWKKRLDQYPEFVITPFRLEKSK